MNILVHHGGQQLGPYSFDEVRTRLAAGHLIDTDLAWVEGTPSWVTLSTLLQSGFGGGPPALPGGLRPAGYAVMRPPATELAMASLVLGILSFLCFSFLAGIPAIICGHMARSRARRAPDQFGGAGLALGGLILGYFSLVVPLLLIPFAIMMPAMESRTDNARNTAARTDLSSLTLALESYELDTGSYPSTIEGLDALVHQPANKPGWQGPYVKKIPQDPWGRAYTYRHPGKQDPKSFDLISSGPDGRLGTDDDVSNEDEGRLKEEEIEDTTEPRKK
jgi:general secretion pathway protein G